MAFLQASNRKFNSGDFRKFKTVADTRFITNELLIIDSIAADGMKKSYRIQLLGSMHDARLSALNSIGGEMYPPVFTERKPPFFLGTDGGVDTWTVSTKEDLVILTAAKMDTEASLTVNGHPIAVGELEGEYRVTNMIARGSVTNWLTNISWQGDFTNVKQIIVNYIDPATDNRILSIDVADSASGYTLPPLPRFHYTTDNYTVILDNIGLCRIMVRLAQTNAAVTLRQETTSTQQQAQNLVADSRSGDSVIYENLRLQQGDLLTFTSTMGSATREYRYRLRAFTTTPYGINGNISRVLQDIQTRKEIVSKSGYAVDVEGIVTFMTDYDENVKAGMFIEDGAGTICLVMERLEKVASNQECAWTTVNQRWQDVLWDAGSGRLLKHAHSQPSHHSRCLPGWNSC